MVVAPCRALAVCGCALWPAAAARRPGRGRGTTVPRAGAPLGVAAAPGAPRGRAGLPRSQGELVHKRPWPQRCPVRADERRRPRRAAAAARRRAAHLRVRRDRLGQDDDDAPRARCAHAHPEGGAADPRPEGRPGGRRADEPARGRGGRAVRADRPAGPGSDRYQPLWGTPGAGRRAGGRADQAIRALLLRRAAAAPRHRLPRAPRRRPLAAVDPVPDRRLPPAPLRGARRNRRAPRRRHRPADPPGRGARPVRVLAQRQRGPLRRRRPAAGRARACQPRDRDTEDHPGRRRRRRRPGRRAQAARGRDVEDARGRHARRGRRDDRPRARRPARRRRHRPACRGR